MEETVVSADWAWLPRDLLDLILDKLTLISDYIEFGAVCKRWQSVAEQHKQQWRKTLCHKQLPMLMQITRNRKSKTNAALFRISEDWEEEGLLRQLSCVPYYNKNRVHLCSTHGWLAYSDELVLTLLNYFTGDTISLPPNPIIQPTNAEQDTEDRSPRIYWVALSADPCLNPNAYEVLVTYCYPHSCFCIAHFNSADATWTQKDDMPMVSNAVYYKGQFFALTLQDLRSPSISIRGITITYPQYCTSSPGNRYIVESSTGDLLLVMIKGFESDVKSVQVHKLLPDAGMGSPKLVEIESIGTDVLFLGGGSQPICISALQFPQCHPNSIYFTHSVFYLESRTMERHSWVKKRRGHRQISLFWI